MRHDALQVQHLLLLEFGQVQVRVVTAIIQGTLIILTNYMMGTVQVT